MTETETVYESGGSLAAAAVSYARDRGWYVLPLRTRGKDPLIKGGVLSASNDPEQVAAWWEQWPTANIGIACGKSGLVVVDVDPRNGGEVEAWESYDTLTVATGGGGIHLYYAAPSDLDIAAKLPGWDGVDLQRGPKYVIAPPSIHPSGDGYRWVSEVGGLQPLPGWIIDAARPPAPALMDAGRRLHAVDTDNPMDWYNANGDLDGLLTDHGYDLVEVRPDGEKYWHRPGGENRFQVTTNYKGTGTVYSFSSETDFPQDEAISPFRAFSILEYGGDDSAAASYIRAVLMNGSRTVVWNGPPEEKKVYSFEPAFAGDWIADYIDYAGSMTDAAKEYHEASALVLLGCVTYGCRLELAPFPGGLGTNLYVGLVGPSTRSRKSTSQQIALDILEQTRPGTQIPNRASSEAMMQLLQARRGNAALWAPDEMGVALGEVYRREYLSALEELLLTLYGNSTYTYVNVHDTVTIENVSMNVLGAATPESIALAGQRAALGGLLPRIGIVFPDPLPPARPVAGERASAAPLIEHLSHVWAWSYGWSQRGGTLSIDGDAIRILNDAETPLTEEKHTARLPVMLYKVAALSALSCLRTEINEADAHSAVTVINRWAAGAERLQPFMRRNASSLEFKNAKNDVLGILRELGPTVPRPVIAREVDMDRALLDRIRNTLEDQAHITIIGGPGKEVWTLTEP